MISLQKFLQLPVEEVAQLVQASGQKVVVFPINGTRRWFTLEYGNQKFDDPIAAYMDISGKRHIELYKLFFDHGVNTLLTPMIGPEILATRDGYMEKIGEQGLRRLVSHPDFVSFYESYDVRVHFYGDYRENLARTSYQHLSDLFDGISEKTSQHRRFRLFFGAFADNLNAVQVIANYAVEHYKKHAGVPDRKTLVEMYYGEYLEKADIFIGFDRFAVFDYPLLNSGEEDLYFTVAPSMYMTERQLRTILYDHLHTRRENDEEYASLSVKDSNNLHQFYSDHRDGTFGIGKRHGGAWVPQIQ